MVSNELKSQDLGYQQNALFEFLWSGTVEHMKRHMLDANNSANPVVDPEIKFIQEDLRDLERGLIESIQRYKRRRFSIAFCGMVKAGKSLFLNALIGQSILPSDGTLISLLAFAVIILTPCL
jgi:ribosome biogenesis GTPase A